MEEPLSDGAYDNEYPDEYEEKKKDGRAVNNCLFCDHAEVQPHCYSCILAFLPEIKLECITVSFPHSGDKIKVPKQTLTCLSTMMKSVFCKDLVEVDDDFYSFCVFLRAVPCSYMGSLFTFKELFGDKDSLHNLVRAWKVSNRYHASKVQMYLWRAACTAPDHALNIQAVRTVNTTLRPAPLWENRALNTILNKIIMQYTETGKTTKRKAACFCGKCGGLTDTCHNGVYYVCSYSKSVIPCERCIKRGASISNGYWFICNTCLSKDPSSEAAAIISEFEKGCIAELLKVLFKSG
eukprot:Platyproteum_vivax@DN6096_c0_g1_i2.p1